MSTSVIETRATSFLFRLSRAQTVRLSFSFAAGDITNFNNLCLTTKKSGGGGGSGTPLSSESLSHVASTGTSLAQNPHQLLSIKLTQLERGEEGRIHQNG